MARFTEAERALIEGKKVRRTNWTNGDYYFLEMQAQKSYLMHHSARSRHNDPASLYWDDVRAKNWEIVA